MKSRDPKVGDIWQNGRTDAHWFILDIYFDERVNTHMARCKSLLHDEVDVVFPFIAIKKYWSYSA
jgi:hypothetical protein